jgi:hypothetical protein
MVIGKILGIVPYFYNTEGRQHFRLSLLDYPPAKPDGAGKGGAKRRSFYR